MLPLKYHASSHTNFNENFEKKMYLKVKYYKMTKESNFHIANGTDNQPKIGKKIC
jgi:hypothetical protein